MDFVATACIGLAHPKRKRNKYGSKSNLAIPHIIIERQKIFDILLVHAQEGISFSARFFSADEDPRYESNRKVGLSQ